MLNKFLNKVMVYFQKILIETIHTDQLKDFHLNRYNFANTTPKSCAFSPTTVMTPIC